MTTIVRIGNSLEIHDIHTVEDLIEALRAFKAFRALSNDWCDRVAGFADGQTDKALGPSRDRGLSPMLFETFHSIFAVKLKMVVDLDQAKVMEARWDGRDGSQVRLESGRVSKKLVERAKPAVLKGFSKLGNDARKLLLPREQQVKIARKAARARARLPKAVRSEISRKGWVKRRRNQLKLLPKEEIGASA